MTSNINVTPGTGATIAADDIGGGLLAQRVKLAVGATGTGVDLAAGQAAMAASIPVVIASNQTSVPVTVPVGQTTMANSTPVTIASNQSTLPVNQVSSSFDIALGFTRPADTTAYAANDVVGGALTFTAIGPSAAPIMITCAQLEIDIAAIPSGMTSFRLYLYNVTPPSALADNTAWDLPSGDRASFLGYIDLGTPVDLGSTLYVEVTNINKQLKLASANVFGYMVTNGGYTPGSADGFKVTLHTVAV